MSVSRKIKSLAFGVGFDFVGIARAEALSDVRSRLESWLQSGFHGEMAWIEREPDKRADPTILLPGAKSVISVALNYFTPHEHSESPGTGKVSRYAWGDDYHDVLKIKLREFQAAIAELLPGSTSKICVDTAPISEKAWAVRAGIGWIGKHSNLITRELGSWVFLGEVLVDAELEYDRPFAEDHCGTCTACIDACPTDAIREPYVVDSTRCLSYATIELRASELPPEIVENLNGWLYGCDICQDVCPWNRFEKPTAVAGFEPREGNVTADLNEITALSPGEYARKFRGSAMKRTKLQGLQRNARALLKRR